MSDHFCLLTITIDSELRDQAEKLFANYGLTLEQAVLLFFKWCGSNPEQAKAALRRWMDVSEVNNV